MGGIERAMAQCYSQHFKRDTMNMKVSSKTLQQALAWIEGLYVEVVVNSATCRDDVDFHSMEIATGNGDKVFYLSEDYTDVVVNEEANTTTLTVGFSSDPERIAEIMEDQDMTFDVDFDIEHFIKSADSITIEAEYWDTSKPNTHNPEEFKTQFLDAIQSAYFFHHSDNEVKTLAKVTKG